MFCSKCHTPIKLCRSITLSTAVCTTDLTCCSSRTSKISGNAFPPASSTENTTTSIEPLANFLLTWIPYFLWPLYKWFLAILDVVLPFWLRSQYLHHLELPSVQSLCQFPAKRPLWKWFDQLTFCKHDSMAIKYHVKCNKWKYAKISIQTQYFSTFLYFRQLMWIKTAQNLKRIKSQWVICFC